MCTAWEKKNKNGNEGKSGINGPDYVATVLSVDTQKSTCVHLQPSRVVVIFVATLTKFF